MWKLSDFGDQIAVVNETGDQISYKRLNEDVNALLKNIPGRCLVFNLCTNTLGSLTGYVAFLNGRIVPLLLDVNLDVNLLHNLMETYKPDYLWAPDIKAMCFPEYGRVCSVNGYELLKTPYNNAFPIHEDLALLLTTSGSTGSPKLVRQSYENIRVNTKSIVEYLEIDETERPITTLPMSYTYGLSIINTHLYAGASIIMTEKTLMQKEFWQQFRDYQATSFGGVPYTYQMLDKLRFYRMNLPSLRTMTQAGGKLAPELHKKFAEYAAANGKRFFVMYGQTEATARMGYLPYQKSIEKYGSMGIAIPGGKFSLIDGDGNKILEPDVVGELVYEGANVTMGYAETGSDLAKGDEWNGKLFTGDMAKRDKDGYYYIVGRKKRFLKIFGNRLNLDEMERMVKEAFPSVDCACSGKDDNLYLFVTDISIKDEAIKFISAKTGLNPVAFHIREIKEIPKNEAGKTLYGVLESYID